MTTPTANRRWYHLTPNRFFVGLLVVQVFLLLSEWFRWFWFNEHKGWTVLIAVALVGLTLLVMLHWGLVGLCLRRRFQFGVRSLLVFLVVVSIPLGWFAWQMDRARRQREAVDRVLDVGGDVYYDYQSSEMLGLAHGGKPTKPTWLPNLLGDDFFYEAVWVIGGAKFDDSDAVHLQELTNLVWLWLDRTAITDGGLAYLNGMSKLKLLRLTGTRVTDEGVEKLQRALPNCQITR